MTQKSVPFYKHMIDCVNIASANPTLRYLFIRKLGIEKAKAELELDHFLKSPAIFKKHNMDIHDAEGWELYYGMSDKLNITTKTLRHMDYKNV